MNFVQNVQKCNTVRNLVIIFHQLQNGNQVFPKTLFFYIQLFANLGKLSKFRREIWNSDNSLIDLFWQIFNFGKVFFKINFCIHFVLHALLNVYVSLHNWKNHQTNMSWERMLTNFFYKQTLPAILKSPFFQAKNNRQQYFCNIVYS